MILRGMPGTMTKQRALTLLMVGLPIVVALGLRLYDLAGESIWLDESVSIGQARDGFLEMIARTSNDNYPPLHNISLFLSMRVFGPTEFGARLPSVVFGTLTVAVVYLIGKALYGRDAGLASAWLVTFSVFQIHYSQEARMYAIFAFFAALSYFFFIRFLERPRSSAGWYYALSAALMLYCQYYAFFALLAQNLFFVVDLVLRKVDRGLRLRRWIVLQILVAVAFLPWLPSLYRQTMSVQEGFWIGPPTWGEVWDLFVTYASGSYAVWFSLALIAALAGLTFFGSRYRQPTGEGHDDNSLSPRGPLILLGLWLLVPIVVPALLSLVVEPFFLTRYTIGASVAWYLLVGAGIASIPPRRTWSVAALVCVAVALSGSELVTYYRVQEKQDWRTAAAILKAESRDTDLFLVGKPHYKGPLEYYFGPSDRITNVIGKAYLEAERVWILSPGPRPCPEQFQGGRRLQEAMQLPKLTICRYGGLMGG